MKNSTEGQRRTRSTMLAVAAAAAIVIGALVAGPASAAPPAPAPAAAMGSGWLRLGHLSPDTKSVDVSVSALSGGSTVFKLTGIGYGDVSAYSKLPVGSYTVSMVPAGSTAATAPVISATVQVGNGTATTVAAYGSAKKLKLKAFADDLTQPAAGKARIRLVQASTLTGTVDVDTSTGSPIARDAKAGSATGYAEIPAGSWTLELKGGRVEDTAKVTVTPGSVTSLFVLDTANGGLTILPIVDSSAAGRVPTGGVATGGGWLAEHHVPTVTIASPKAV